MSQLKNKFVPVRSFDAIDEEAEREGNAVKFQGEVGCLGRPPKGKTMRQVQDELKVAEVTDWCVPERPRDSFCKTGI